GSCSALLPYTTLFRSGAARAAGTGVRVSVITIPSAALAARQIALEPLTVLRHPEAEDPVDDDREQERLDEVLLPREIRLDRLLRSEEHTSELQSRENL